MEHRKRNADATTKSHGFRSREDPFTGNLEDKKPEAGENPDGGCFMVSNTEPIIYSDMSIVNIYLNTSHIR